MNNESKSFWSSRLIFFIPVIFIFVGIGFCIFTVKDSWEQYQLIQKGENVQGYITDASERTESDTTTHSTKYYYDYIYSYQLPDGREFDGYVSGSGHLPSELSDLTQPYPIEVTYLPDNPDVSRISEKLPDSTMGLLLESVILFVAGAVCLIIGITVMIIFRKKRKNYSSGHDFSKPYIDS